MTDCCDSRRIVTIELHKYIPTAFFLRLWGYIYVVIYKGVCSIN